MGTVLMRIKVLRLEMQHVTVSQQKSSCGPAVSGVRARSPWMTQYKNVSCRFSHSRNRNFIYSVSLCFHPLGVQLRTPFPFSTFRFDFPFKSKDYYEECIDDCVVKSAWIADEIIKTFLQTSGE